MIRNIKALGLAFVAVAAMSMVAAGGAQAAQLHANSAAPVNIHGEQTTVHKFQITHPDGPGTECAQALFETSTPAAITAEEGTFTAQYTGCQAFGQAAQISMNGCKYTITGAGKGALKAQVDITGCTSGKQIVVKTAICTITVPEQNTIAGNLEFSPGAGVPVADVNVKIAVSGIKYQVHGAVCGHTVNTTTSDGTYNGDATFKAFTPGPTEQITHNGHQFNYRQTQVTQVALTAT